MRNEFCATHNTNRNGNTQRERNQDYRWIRCNKIPESIVWDASDEEFPMKKQSLNDGGLGR